MFYQLVQNSQLAQQQSMLSSKDQAPDPTIVRLTSPFKMSRPGQTCSLVPGVHQVSVGLCLLGQKGAGQQHSAGCVRSRPARAGAGKTQPWSLGGPVPGPIGQGAGPGSWRWAWGGWGSPGAVHARCRGGEAWMEAAVGERAASCGGDTLTLHVEVIEARACGQCS